MSRFGRAALVWFVLLLAAAPAAHAEKRIALLIGNQNYTSEIGGLANPHNDVALLEKTLKDLRFEVTSVRDAGLAALHQTVNAYARRVRAAGPNAVGFFYYAGHGAADTGTNYLIPVDVKSAEEGELWDVSLRLTEITRKLKAEAGNATHFVVFDACRNNLKLRKAGSRALVQSRGFVPVSQESGMLVAYATAEGELASDVGAGAGPYAKVLAQEIVKPGVEAVEMFRRVQRRVRADINQEPYLGFNALGDVYLGGLSPNPPNAAVAPAPAVGAQQREAEWAWAVAERAASIPALEAFIRRFGDTYYGDLAKARLAELKQIEVAKQAANAAAAEAARICREVEGMTSVSLLGVLASQHRGTPASDCIGARVKELSKQALASPPPQQTLTPPPRDRNCVVADPTGTPLNVRAVPQGAITSTLPNGAAVKIVETQNDSKGQPWAYLVSGDGRQRLGWVIRRFVNCP